jgi:hypothetical protein
MLRGKNNVPSVVRLTGLSYREVHLIRALVVTNTIPDEFDVDPEPPAEREDDTQLKSDPEDKPVKAARANPSAHRKPLSNHKSITPYQPTARENDSAAREQSVAGCVILVAVVALIAFGVYACWPSGSSNSSRGASSRVDGSILEKLRKVQRAMGLPPPLGIEWDAKDPSLWVGTVRYQGGGSGLIYYWPKTGEWKMQ